MTTCLQTPADEMVPLTVFLLLVPRSRSCRIQVSSSATFQRAMRFDVDCVHLFSSVLEWWLLLVDDIRQIGSSHHLCTSALDSPSCAPSHSIGESSLFDSIRGSICLDSELYTIPPSEAPTDKLAVAYEARLRLVPTIF